MNEPIFEIQVRCLEAAEVAGHTKKIVMIPFTGTAKSAYFTGEVVGTGTDTQRIGKDGVCRLSARYILEGKDMTGKKCKIFIENETCADGGLHPSIVTDSEALAKWEAAELYSEISPSEGGVTVKIFAV